MQELANGISDPWICFRDFNAILNVYERKEGSKNRSTICKLFQSFLHDISLQDMGFHGPMFAWNRGELFQRLDRAICNEQWVNFALNYFVHYLHKLKLDHMPLTVATDSIASFVGDKPFWCLASWQSHLEFNDLVRGNWNVSTKVVANIKGCLGTFLQGRKSWWQSCERCKGLLNCEIIQAYVLVRSI